MVASPATTSPSPPVDTRGRALAEIASFFDSFAAVEQRWRSRNRTYYRLVESVHRFLIPRGARVLELGSGSGDLLASLEPARGLGIDVSGEMTKLARARHPDLEFVEAAAEDFRRDELFDYVVLSDFVSFAYDLQAVFANVAAMTHARSRVVIHSYSQLWRPVIRLAELLSLKKRKPIRNWVTPEDLDNLLQLAGLETVAVTPRILMPKKIPLLTNFLNGIVANIWPFTHLCLTYWVVARQLPTQADAHMGVSVVIPARNEAGMIAEIVERVPELGSATELVFVEGGSSDDTYDEIARQIASRPERSISLYRQTGTGKADAVRLGFDRAQHDLLMILDADLTVPPEELSKFYDAVARGYADFVNGSRLVYDLEPGAMQTLNVFGNKAFSRIFSYLMRQNVKDTLCGTKVLLRDDYAAIAQGRADFGDFDPFGDFDLLLGAARRGLKIVDLPVHYHARRYGTTNISRFSHGWLLLKMAFVGFDRLKYRPVRV